MDPSDIEKLENAIIMSKLGHGISYCEVNGLTARHKVVVCNGMALSFSLFSDLMIKIGADAVYHESDFNVSIISFWKDVCLPLDQGSDCLTNIEFAVRNVAMAASRGEARYCTADMELLPLLKAVSEEVRSYSD